jgi:hypothetical protein
MMIRTSVLFLSGLFVCGVFLPLTIAAPPHPSIPQDAQNGCEATLLKRLIPQTPIIVSAKVKELGDAPGFSSVFILTAQRIRYEVIDVLKGSFPEREFIGAHVISAGSVSTDRDGGRLSPAIFAEGNNLLLLLRPGRKREKWKGDRQLSLYRHE